MDHLDSEKIRLAVQKAKFASDLTVFDKAKEVMKRLCTNLKIDDRLEAGWVAFGNQWRSNF